ncbi:MAG TPA: DUF559 domain-containing protein [Allosphingosinicella sp.]
MGPYALDFFCHQSGLAIEVDGIAHEMGDNPRRDARRDAWLAERGVMTFRVTAADVLGETEAVVRMVVHLCRERSPPPNSSPRFRGEGDRLKAGGGVLPDSARSPSTRLRLVPLPCKGKGGILFDQRRGQILPWRRR